MRRDGRHDEGCKDNHGKHQYTHTALQTAILFNMAPAFKSFTLALIQLGKITANKQDNLQHARDMILKAANNIKKPDLIVLPVCVPFRNNAQEDYITLLGVLQLALWA
jgi:hypothetical protein